MQSAILLLAVVSQCSGGSCPTPSFRMPMPQYRPAYRQPHVSAQQPQLDMRSYALDSAYRATYRAAMDKYVGIHQDSGDPGGPGIAASPEDQRVGEEMAREAQRRNRLSLLWTKYKGLELQVWGFKNSSGLIEWNPELPANVESYRKAEAAIKAVPPADPSPQNFGLNREQIGKHKGYSGNVAEYHAKSAEANNKLFLTVIGSPEDRAQVVADWKTHPEYEGLRDRVYFGAFSRGEWQVADELGYAATGKPTILIQRPSGTVAYRAYDYSGGAHSVAQALRKADPNYKPAKDPGPNGEQVVAFDDPVALAFVVIGAVLLALIVVPRRSK